MKVTQIPGHLKRYKDLIKLFIKYGKNGFLLKRNGGEDFFEYEEETRSQKATVRAEGEKTTKVQSLADGLEKLGPTYVKLGQFLSTRSDMITSQYMEALSRLQDNVASFPFQQVQEIITEELGIRFRKHFQNSIRSRWLRHP